MYRKLFHLENIRTSLIGVAPIIRLTMSMQWCQIRHNMDNWLTSQAVPAAVAQNEAFTAAVVIALGLAGRIAGSVFDARFAVLPRRAKLTVTLATHRRHLFCIDAQEIRIT
jgi:hypothetical protein